MKQLAREVGNVLLCDEVCDHSCDVSACVILLKFEVMSINLQEWENVRTGNFITEPNTCQVTINDLQLGSVCVMYGDASP